MSKVGRIESHCLFEVSCLNCVFYISSCQHLGSILIIYEAVSLTQKPHGQALRFYGAISALICIFAVDLGDFHLRLVSRQAWS